MLREPSKAVGNQRQALALSQQIYCHHTWILHSLNTRLCAARYLCPGTTKHQPRSAMDGGSLPWVSQGDLTSQTSLHLVPLELRDTYKVGKFRSQQINAARGDQQWDWNHGRHTTRIEKVQRPLHLKGSLPSSGASRNKPPLQALKSYDLSPLISDNFH